MKDRLDTTGNTNHFDAAAEHNENAATRISPLQNNLKCWGILLPAKCCESSNLPTVQLRKHRLDLFGRIQHQFTRIKWVFLCNGSLRNNTVQTLPASSSVCFSMPRWSGVSGS